MRQNVLLVILGAFLLSSCTIRPYVPRIRDVREDRFDGDVWRQRFTLYNPANPGSDCPLDRVGQRIDLNSDLAIADAWRTYCRTTSDNNQRSDNN